MWVLPLTLVLFVDYILIIKEAKGIVSFVIVHFPKKITHLVTILITIMLLECYCTLKGSKEHGDRIVCPIKVLVDIMFICYCTLMVLIKRSDPIGKGFKDHVRIPFSSICGYRVDENKEVELMPHDHEKVCGDDTEANNEDNYNERLFLVANKSDNALTFATNLNLINQILIGMADVFKIHFDESELTGEKYYENDELREAIKENDDESLKKALIPQQFTVRP